jgi:Max protein
VLFLQVSRAQILKKAAEYIQFIRRKNQSHQSDIDDLKKQNSTLEQQSMFKVKSQDL